MRSCGCDLFPEIDAICYVKGLAIKHPETENNVKQCIGLLSTSHTFSWSRWNATRNSQQIVFQMKELRGCIAKQVGYSSPMQIYHRNLSGNNDKWFHKIHKFLLTFCFKFQSRDMKKYFDLNCLHLMCI